MRNYISEIKGFKLPIGQKWLVNYSQSEKFSFVISEKIEDKNIEQGINDMFDKYSKVIEEVQNKFIEHSEKLSIMKSY